MTSKRLIFLLLLMLPVCLWGQNRIKTTEAGLFLGTANYQGDLAPSPLLSQSGPAIGLMLRRNASPYFSYGLHLNYGIIHGSDENYKNVKARQVYYTKRNLSFRSPVLELSFQTEFNFFPFAIGRDKWKTRNFTPFLFTGISYFYFNPQAELDGDWHDLQPLSTEGQGLGEGLPKPYSRLQFSIPIGFGLKFHLAERWNLQLQCAFNTAFTDYLDDVSGNYADLSLIRAKKGTVAAALADRSADSSGKPGFQRGNPSQNDWYVFTGMSLSYVINQRLCPRFDVPGLHIF